MITILSMAVVGILIWYLVDMHVRRERIRYARLTTRIGMNKYTVPVTLTLLQKITNVIRNIRAIYSYHRRMKKLNKAETDLKKKNWGRDLRHPDSSSGRSPGKVKRLTIPREGDIIQYPSGIRYRYRRDGWRKISDKEEAKQ